MFYTYPMINLLIV